MAGGVFLPIPRLRQGLFLLVESAILVAVLLLALLARFGGYPTEISDDPLLVLKVSPPFLLQLSLYYSDLYDERAIRWRAESFVRLAKACFAAFLLLSFLYYLLPSLKFGRGILLLYLPLSLVAILLWRMLHQWLSGQDAFSETVLIVGTGVSAQQVAIEMLARPPMGYRIAGFLGEHSAEVGRRLVNPSVIGTVSQLRELVSELKVNRIVVALEDRRGKMPVKELLACRMAGVAVEEATSFYEQLTGKILVNNLRPSWLVFSQGFNKPRLLRNSKRLAELLVALVLLILTAPLLALIALLVRLDSRGPAFYGQSRVGERGRPFLLIKFRTMRTDAEAISGPVWAQVGRDPRVTRAGGILRKSRLDELPQLINILRGEMSFVGPRPERPHFVDQFRQIIPYYDERHTVKPGITGWAQVKFRYGSTIEDAEEKHQYDLFYIKHMSFLLDFTILMDTFKVVLFGKGAR